jgi:hypothetical protein
MYYNRQDTPEDRPIADQESSSWFDEKFKQIIQQAVLIAAGLKEIGRTAEDCAIRIVNRRGKRKSPTCSKALGSHRSYFADEKRKLAIK